MAERPEDLNLPNAVITRIIKDAIPDGVNVSKEARLAVSKAASVFVLYATSCSNNFALKAKRKTISAQDVISAMEDMEFDQFVKPLEECLAAYRSDQKGKKEQKKKEKEQSNTTKEEEEEVIIEDDDEDEGAGGDANGPGDEEVHDVGDDDEEVVEISDDSSET